MSKIKKIKTTPEVYAVIRASHPELIIFGTYSAPGGSYYHPDIGIMRTSYGFKESEWPIIEVETRWDIDIDIDTGKDKVSEYWLYVPNEIEEN